MKKGMSKKHGKKTDRLAGRGDAPEIETDCRFQFRERRPFPARRAGFSSHIFCVFSQLCGACPFCRRPCLGFAAPPLGSRFRCPYHFNLNVFYGLPADLSSSLPGGPAWCTARQVSCTCASWLLLWERCEPSGVPYLKGRITPGP